MPSNLYTIIVGGQPFVLTRDQLDSDSPNEFTCHFSKTTSNTNKVAVHQDPHIFTIIHSHLLGYDVMPLPENWFPRYMSKEAAMDNLIADAKYYRFTKLVEILQAAPAEQRVPLFPLKRGLNLVYWMNKKTRSLPNKPWPKEWEKSKLTYDEAVFWIEQAIKSDLCTVFKPSCSTPIQAFGWRESDKSSGLPIGVHHILAFPKE